jgi:hypothetical protein
MIKFEPETPYRFEYVEPEPGELPAGADSETFIIEDEGGRNSKLIVKANGNVIMKGLRIGKELPVLVILFRKTPVRRFYIGKVTEVLPPNKEDNSFIRKIRGRRGRYISSNEEVGDLSLRDAARADDDWTGTRTA